MALLIAVAGFAAASVPTVTLNNGVAMPLVQLGLGGYNDSYATEAVVSALGVGFSGIDTAHDYGNQDGVAAGIAAAGTPRNSVFITTKIPGCEVPAICKVRSEEFIANDLKLLGMGQVDLMLAHYTPLGGCASDDDCKMVQTQYAALEDAYNAGKARAIGVSNFCVSCLECLAKTQTVPPAVNQVQFHVGMGSDPQGLLGYCREKGIQLEAYSPLGSGNIVSNPLFSSIGEAYNKTGPQVALKWIVQRQIPIAVKAHSPEYLAQDIDLFTWNLTDADLARLDQDKSIPYKPELFCSK
jgi:diketogulonate reductase-like aldo/keto reductase